MATYTLSFIESQLSTYNSAANRGKSVMQHTDPNEVAYFLKKAIDSILKIHIPHALMLQDTLGQKNGSAVCDRLQLIKIQLDALARACTSPRMIGECKEDGVKAAFASKLIDLRLDSDFRMSIMRFNHLESKANSQVAAIFKHYFFNYMTQLASADSMMASMIKSAIPNVSNLFQFSETEEARLMAISTTNAKNISLKLDTQHPVIMTSRLSDKELQYDTADPALLMRLNEMGIATDKIETTAEVFKIIYSALYQGQSFLKKDSFLDIHSGKDPVEFLMAVVEHMDKNEKNRTSVAMSHTKSYVNALSNADVSEEQLSGLYRKVYQETRARSGFGLFQLFTASDINEGEDAKAALSKLADEYKDSNVGKMVEELRKLPTNKR